MCGIAGVINASGATPHDVRAMVDSIRYRGRDEAGVKSLSENTIIGHARLVVVDGATGQQPMTNEDESIWVTFNGEIYNFVELREELKAKGYKFKSKSDTEILIHLWREEGENMLSRLIGMFAFFLWDVKNNRGILARDRQGIKPCFIAPYNGGYAFASEIKAILSLPGMPCEINYAGLKDVFYFNYCPPPQTCYKNITHLEHGHYLLFEGKNAPVKKRYWQWPFGEAKNTPSFEEFESLLEDALRIQMRFDVDGAMYLSGGVDSSVVAYHLKKLWGSKKLEAFGLNFPNQDYSEFRYSKEVADLLGIDLHEAHILPEMIPDIAARVVAHAEQPHGDFSFFLYYLLAERTNKDGKIVIFTGDGPDESLAGQHFHKQPPAGFSMHDYFTTIGYMDAAMQERLLNKDFVNNTPSAESRFNSLLAPYRKLSHVDQIVAYESNNLLPGNNLLKGERMAAAWSIETRSPFLDHRVSEVFIKLPDEQKFGNGHSKYFLKEYAAQRLPRDLIFKKKTMPTVPIGEWMKTTLYSWARDTLSRHDGSFMNRNAAMALLEEHKSGAQNHTRALRTMIMSQLWLENCVQASAHRKVA